VKGLLDDTESLGQMGQDVLNRVTELLSPKNLENITGSADGLNTLLAELSDLLQSEGENLKETISSLNRAADGLAEVAGPELREDLESTMESVASTMASADSAMGRLNATSVSVEAAVASLQTILTRIESGEGTLGRLWASDSLHTSLLTTAESVRLLLVDLRENPGRYFTVSVF
jgi:phospholipid/cholesterol/gamma-HCH transport system substrate-binding protein